MAEIKEGSVSTTTLREQDLIPAFFAELTRVNYSRAQRLELDWYTIVRNATPSDYTFPEISVNGIRASFVGKEGWAAYYVAAGPFPPDNHPVWKTHECGQYLWEQLIDALNDEAPDGMYFGNTEGNMSDYGWWANEIEPEMVGAEPPTLGNSVV